ncbi:hypothetical protein SKAU_G00282730 [Synaphobranchus kaupii]|uniref:TGFBR3/Endoglin-like N-terminal domain-containing protein n=1 Tax=Synaphobranchus kaupii TaxID=118154 RepID=A0A9Q1EXI0_SYNKA|nr:hypothetical protein SKAU_G00282730 [Synaphobranchus kaupii]
MGKLSGALALDRAQEKDQRSQFADTPPPVSQMTCNPEDVHYDHNGRISVVQGVSPGCWTHYTKEGAEVHVLDLRFNPNSNNNLHFLLLNLTAARPGHVIINSNAKEPFQVTLQENDNVNVLMKKHFSSLSQF